MALDKSTCIAYYTLDNTLNDATGNLSALTNTGWSYNASGKINGCYSATGGNDTLNTGQSTYFRTTEGAVSMWIYPTATSGDFILGDRISGSGASVNWMQLMNYNNATNTVFFSFDLGDTEASASAVGYPIAINTWGHIVATWGSRGMEIWVNGTLRASNVSHTSNWDNGGSGSTMRIGAVDQYSGSWFEGRIDEVGFFNVQIDSDAISSLYNSGNGLSYDDFPTSGYANKVNGVSGVGKVNSVEAGNISKVDGV